MKYKIVVRNSANMIKINLHTKKYTLEELLALASSDSLVIHGKDGKSFILEETDDFEKEVENMGNSEKFMSFLGERSKEKETIPIDVIAEKLEIETVTKYCDHCVRTR